MEDAMRCYCFLRNINDVLKDGLAAWSKRFGSEFIGPRIPVGAEIIYKPITEKDQQRLHKFWLQDVARCFLGYDQRAGGSWSGDLIVADWEEFENAEFISEI